MRQKYKIIRLIDTGRLFWECFYAPLLIVLICVGNAIVSYLCNANFSMNYGKEFVLFDDNWDSLGCVFEFFGKIHFFAMKTDEWNDELLIR